MSSNISATRTVRFAPTAIAALVFSFTLALGNRPLVWAQNTDSSGGSATELPVAKQSVDKQSALDQGKHSEQTPEQKMAAEKKRLEEAAEQDALDQAKQEQEKAENDVESQEQADAASDAALAPAQAELDDAYEAAQTADDEAQKAAQDAPDNQGEDQGQ